MAIREKKRRIDHAHNIEVAAGLKTELEKTRMKHMFSPGEWLRLIVMQSNTYYGLGEKYTDWITLRKLARFLEEKPYLEKLRKEEKK